MCENLDISRIKDPATTLKIIQLCCILICLKPCLTAHLLIDISLHQEYVLLSDDSAWDSELGQIFNQ
jgi:hypothetical protein